MVSTLTKSIEDSKLLFEQKHLDKLAERAKGKEISIIHEQSDIEYLEFEAEYQIPILPKIGKISSETWIKLLENMKYKKGRTKIKISSLPFDSGKTSYAYKINDVGRKMK